MVKLTEEDRQKHKLMIEATREGWFDVIKELVPPGKRRDERMLFAHNQALRMWSIAPMDMINGAIGTFEEVRAMARKAAKEKSDMRAWLLGEELPN